MAEAMQEIRSLIEKFWAGSATDDEKQRLIELMAGYDQEWVRTLEAEFRAQLNKEPEDRTPGETQRILEQLHKKIAVMEGDQPAGKGKILPFLRPLRWIAAAAIPLALGIAMLWHSPGKNNQTATVRRESPKTRQLRQYANPDTTVQHILLPDSSALDLYPGSQAAYYEPFDTARAITVNGKALFKVTSGPHAPFTVYSKGIATSVLGTKFMVIARDDNRVSVLLMEGKVRVQAMPGTGIEMQGVYLAPGQKLAVNMASKDYVVGKWQPADTGSVTNKPTMHTRKPEAIYACVFDKTPLARVFSTLSDYYKVRIIVNAQDLEGQSFTGKILRTDQLQTALSVICNTNDLTFRTDNGDIIINKQK
ncbi:FecR family protein [Puia dinghuensis]|uniref:DUF4974 domain-containing protein n=1 Tax=Puia dinghuensis TaxID=1792502 RepID=A0A8J2UDZ2_9BACT|nr:FecR family protein [Puia dinghuensis]GGB04777.1 hypothetical protein GCM10011511_30120 [Puia dinghuensis]